MSASTGVTGTKPRARRHTSASSATKKTISIQRVTRDRDQVREHGTRPGHKTASTTRAKPTPQNIMVTLRFHQNQSKPNAPKARLYETNGLTGTEREIHIGYLRTGNNQFKDQTMVVTTTGDVQVPTRGENPKAGTTTEPTLHPSHATTTGTPTDVID